MDPGEQLELVRDFMVAIAPAVAHSHLEQGGYTAAETAKATLELAMHLASQFAQCHDALHATPENAPQKLSTDLPTERQAPSPGTGV